MHQHQHGPQCNHGHGHQQGHGHGHGHGAMQGMMGMAGQANEQSPEEYFANLKKKWNEKENRVFFWQQVLHGVVLDKLYEKYGLQFMRSITCQLPQMIINSVQMMISFEFIPLRLKPITSGLFFPLLFLLFFNYNVVVGVTATDQLLKTLVYATMTLYVLVALRGFSSLKDEKVVEKCKEIYEVRPYLQNQMMTCQACKITRMFRATHCPFCKVCVAKHSRHSLVFGSCIGAANQFLCTLFFLSLTLTLALIVYHFWVSSTYGLLTKVMFYSLNVTLCWMSFVEFLQFFVFNYVYGVTEQELKIWFMLQYLQKIPERTFSNNVNQGFCINLTGSLMALFGISGFESETSWSKPQLTFPNVDSNRTYLVNWAKALLYLVPQLPFYKNREQIIQMMQRDQPRMIEMFRLQKIFKAQIMAEAGSEQLNEFQVQQRMAMKMQAHMARNMPQMMMPSPDQQKAIQLQMLAHMKKQFANDPDLFQKFNELQSKLKGGEMNPIEANMTMRMLQQQLMARRMQKLQQQVNQQKPAQKSQEQAPMREMADQDL